MAATSLGHPRGLYTLFFTEMWERLSYYGMRALLVLFMVDQIERGGLGLTDKTANAIYGLYTAAVYLACLPGGWMADRLLGAQRAVWWGGILIAIGHFILGVPMVPTFFLGLIFVVLGTGLLKPNVSTLVGYLYPEGGARRDAGFSIFYMGINLGAFVGPLVCSSLGEGFQLGSWRFEGNWHYGFTAAGVGMVLGLTQYALMRRQLGDAGNQPPQRSGNPAVEWSLIGAALAAIALVFTLTYTGTLRMNPVQMADMTKWVIVGCAIAYFAWAFLLAGLTPTEKGRVVVIGMLFVACAMFWAGFEQAGSSLNLFAERHTLRYSPLLNFEAPAGWFQSLNPIFIISLAPVFAWLWVALARRNIEVSLTTKMAWGLLLMGLGFVVAALAARQAQASGRVWPTWLVSTFLIHTFGELCLSPVGLSAVTKLAPAKLVGQMMGVWFMATALGNLIAGLIAGEASENLAEMPSRFFQIVIIACITGVIYLAIARPMQRLSGGVQ
jgi:POT family proton-dependent oligopeptide transporter